MTSGCQGTNQHCSASRHHTSIRHYQEASRGPAEKRQIRSYLDSSVTSSSLKVMMTLQAQDPQALTDRPAGERQTDFTGVMEWEHHWYDPSSWSDQVDEEERRQSFGKVKSQVHVPGPPEALPLGRALRPRMYGAVRWMNSTKVTQMS